MTTDALGLPYSGASKFIELKDDSTQTYVRPISTTPILGNKGSRIFAYIENHCLPVLLDTGADITVMSKSQLQALVRPSMSNDRKTVKSFDGGEVTLQGPRYLQLHICGVSIVQPFYTIDDETPIIIGFDALVAARIIIDPYRRLAYSHFNYIGHSPEPLSMTHPHAEQPLHSYRLSSGPHTSLPTPWRT